MADKGQKMKPKKTYRIDEGKDIPGRERGKPDGWKPMPTRHMDMSKAVRHQLDDGLVFYGDINTGGVSTSREDTYLKSYSYGSNTEYRHDFLTLCIDGKKIFILPSLEPGKGFFSAMNRTEDGRYIWTIGDIRGNIEIRDVYSYPWVPYGERAPWTVWEGIGQFESHDQQRHFLYVLERFLGILGCNHLRLMRGEEKNAIIEYDADIQEKLDAGELLL